MMALAAHIAELAEKHRNLERKIEAEVARPGSDDIEIHRLKLEKLKLKDEIVRWSNEETRHYILGKRHWVDPSRPKPCAQAPEGPPGWRSCGGRNCVFPSIWL